MRKLYESPKAEVICYFTPDIISVSGKAIAQNFQAADNGSKDDGLISFSQLHG